MCRRLLGRGQALLALNRDADALSALRSGARRRSVADRPGAPRRGAEVPQRRAGTRRGRATRRAPAGSTRRRRPTRAAIASSPDSAFLYRELAGVERQKGDTDAALEHFRKAVDARSRRREDARADRRDARSARRLRRRAEGLRRRARRSSRAPTCEKRLESVRAKAALARLPAEYRAIDQAPQITRADLAALIGIRLARAAAGRSPQRRRAHHRRAQPLGGDLDHGGRARRRHGAVREPRLPAAHGRPPRPISRRRSARLLARIAAQNPARAKAWDAARLKFSDLSPSHLAYPAASAAVASGVMKTVGGQQLSAVEGGHGRGSDRGDRRQDRRRSAGSRDDGADAGQSAHAAADAADSGVRDPGALRLSRLGAGRVRDRRRHRRPRRPDRAALGPEDHARRVARSDGRQAAAGHHLRRADAAGPRPGEPPAGLADRLHHQPRRRASSSRSRS